MKSQTKSHDIMSQKVSYRMKTFQVFFLRDDENQTVDVVETNNLDFDELNNHLEFGESIFITSKDKSKKPDKVAPDRFTGQGNKLVGWD